MSATTTLPDGAKYRVAIRFIAEANGWVFTQIDTATDSFTRGEETVVVTHTPSQRIKAAQYASGEHFDTAGPQGKMFTVQAWLTGVADPINPATGKGSNFIRLSPELVKKYESGRGLAKIAVIEPASEAVSA